MYMPLMFARIPEDLYKDGFKAGAAHPIPPPFDLGGGGICNFLTA